MEPRPRLFLGLRRKDFPLLLEIAKAIYNGLLGHPSLFVDPQPPLPTLQGKIQAFDTAQQLTFTKTKGAAAARDLRASELITSLEGARTYVQALIDAAPDQATLLSEAAAMKLGQASSYYKPFLQATQSVPSGPVSIIANVGVLTADTEGKVFFNWQFSADSGKTWMNAPSTPHGDTEIADLTPMVTYVFRASVTARKGTSAWSEVVTLLVR
jgi:hypothetical protein